MNRSEVWARARVSVHATTAHADQVLREFDERFRAQAGGPDLEDSAAARSGQVPLQERDLQMLRDGLDVLQPDSEQQQDLRDSLCAMLTRCIRGERFLTVS